MRRKKLRNETKKIVWTLAAFVSIIIIDYFLYPWLTSNFKATHDLISISDVLAAGAIYILWSLTLFSLILIRTQSIETSYIYFGYFAILFFILSIILGVITALLVKYILLFDESITQEIMSLTVICWIISGSIGFFLILVKTVAESD